MLSRYSRNFLTAAYFKTSCADTPFTFASAERLGLGARDAAWPVVRIVDERRYLFVCRSRPVPHSHHFHVQTLELVIVFDLLHQRRPEQFLPLQPMY